MDLKNQKKLDNASLEPQNPIPNRLERFFLSLDQYIDDQYQIKVVYLAIVLGITLSVFSYFASIKGWIHYVWVKGLLILIFLLLNLFVANNSVSMGGNFSLSGWEKLKYKYSCGSQKNYLPNYAAAGWLSCRLRLFYKCFVIPALVFFGIAFFLLSLIMIYLNKL